MMETSQIMISDTHDSSVFEWVGVGACGEGGGGGSTSSTRTAWWLREQSRLDIGSLSR